MGLTVVATSPASMIPNKAIGNSGTFGNKMATVSPGCSFNRPLKDFAKLMVLLRISTYLYCRPVSLHI